MYGHEESPKSIGWFTKWQEINCVLLKQDAINNILHGSGIGAKVRHLKLLFALGVSSHSVEERQPRRPRPSGEAASVLGYGAATKSRKSELREQLLALSLSFC